MADNAHAAGFIPAGRSIAAERGWLWTPEAWDFMGKQRWMFVGLFVVLCLIQIAANFVPLLGSIAMSLLGPVFIGGFALGCEAVRRGERLEMGHLYAGFKHNTSKLVGVGAVSLAFAVIVGILGAAMLDPSVLTLLASGVPPTPEQVMGIVGPLLSFVLVVLALSVPLTMATLFAIPLIVFNDFDLPTALKTSFAACLKNILPFTVWGAVMLVLAILASIPYMLGWLLLGPVIIVSLYLAYRDVFYEA